MKYIILIPAYEPDDKLIQLLKVIDNKYTTIIVDDGSGDGYKKIFKEAKKYAHVITYEVNMGKGYALKSGIKYIDENYHNYVIVTMDCDMQHDINDAIKLCNYASKHADTLVLGKRTWDKTMPVRSRIGNSITRFVFKMNTGLKIYDTQTGLRAFSNQLTDYMLKNTGNRYEYEMNVLLNLKKNKIRYHEIVIKTIYINKNATSHFNAFKDSYLIYKEILKNKRTRKD